jgi:hypothetical protein
MSAFLRKQKKIFTGGDRQITSYPRNSVLCQIGDSRTDIAVSAWAGTSAKALQGMGGVFEGWTSYNMGQNGQSLAGYFATIASGNQSDPPINSASNNLWRTVNANPQAIIISLMTNDFRTGARTAQLPAKITTARANLAGVINFLLEKTSASIILRMPPPIAFANPDPGGYTDCLDADDAAARSAAMRMLHLEWLNVSDRVIVIDTHRHIYGYRLDSVAAAVDPEGAGALMADTLHNTGLGASRECQVIERTINPAVPYTSGIITLGARTDVSPIFAIAQWAKTVVVQNSGAGYIDIVRNPLDKIARLSDAAPLNHLPYVRLAAYYANLTDMKEIQRIGSYFIYFHNTGETFGPLLNTGFSDTPAGGVWRLLVTGGPVAKTGPATIYVTSENEMPYASGNGVDHCVISINGPQPLTVNAMGAASLNLLRGVKILGIPACTRSESVGAATIGIYRATGAGGDINVSSVNYPYPGIELGVLTIPNGFRSSGFSGGNFAVNTTNFPSGIVSFTATSGTVISAKVLTGSLGLYGQITIPFTRP